MVSEYQTPGKIHEAGRDEIVDHIRTCVPSLAKSRLEKFADKVIAAADAQTVRLPGEERIARIVAQLAGELIRIDGQLKKLDSEIVEITTTGTDLTGPLHRHHRKGDRCRQLTAVVASFGAIVSAD